MKYTVMDENTVATFCTGPTHQLELEIDVPWNSPEGLRARIRNLLFMGEADRLSALLDIRWEHANDACHVWEMACREFLNSWTGQGTQVFDEGVTRLTRFQLKTVEKLLTLKNRHD